MGLECHLHVFYKIMLCLVALKKDIVWPHETVAVATTNGAIEHDFIKHKIKLVSYFSKPN
jgi:hypothetical protein